MKIAFVITHAYGMGGTVRTVATLANQLSGRHEVELISVNRRRDQPFFPIDPNVKVRVLHDRRARSRGGWLWSALTKRPSRMLHRRDGFYTHYTLWSDLQLAKVIQSLDADVLVTTRPALSLFAARWAHRLWKTRWRRTRVVTVAQEHSFIHSHHREIRKAIRVLYPRLDCVVSLTHGNVADMTAVLGDGGAGIRQPVIPNSIETDNRPISTQENKVVIAAGRLTGTKQHQHLVRAFQQVVRAHPDWQLRIYGSGPRKEALRRQIEELGLYNHVFLMGASNVMDREFAKASISVMSSKYEGLGMTILESMACGVPVVSYDCDHGPRSIITSGEDGLLVTNGDPDALATGITTLIEDEQRRREMAKAAINTVAAYEPRAIAQQWEQLFTELVAARNRAGT